MKEFADQSKLNWARRAGEDKWKKEQKRRSGSKLTEGKCAVVTQDRDTIPGDIARPFVAGTSSSSKSPKAAVSTTTSKETAAPASVSQQSPPSTPAAQKQPATTSTTKRSTVPAPVSQSASPVQSPPKKPLSPKPALLPPLKSLPIPRLKIAASPSAAPSSSAGGTGALDALPAGTLS